MKCFEKKFINLTLPTIFTEPPKLIYLVTFLAGANFVIDLVHKMPRVLFRMGQNLLRGFIQSFFGYFVTSTRITN